MKLTWFTTDDGRIRVHSLVVPDDGVQEMASDIPGWIEQHGGRLAWEVPEAEPGDASAGPLRTGRWTDERVREKGRAVGSTYERVPGHGFWGEA
jgi:hypothetical protein